MKAGRSIEELARELERQNNAKRDFTADTRGVEFELREPDTFDDGLFKEGLNTLAIAHKKPDMGMPRLALKGVDDSKFLITAHTHGQIASHLDIPKKYYDAMLKNHPDLLSVTVNTLFRRDPKPRLIRTLDGSARAFLSNKYRTIDNYQIAGLALQIMVDSGARVVSSEVTESKLYIKALFPKTEAEVKKGDPVQSGVVITNSEIGMGRMTVQPLVMRLVCLNGMIMQDSSIKRTHLGARMDTDGDGMATEYRADTLQALDHALSLQIRDTMRALASPEKIMEHVAKIKTASERMLEGDPVAAVQVLQKKAGFGDEERGGILRHLIQGGDLSQWGLTSAVTRYSQDIDDYDRATGMELLGGQIIEMQQTDWRAIATATA